jgi:hypothetical protein
MASASSSLIRFDWRSSLNLSGGTGAPSRTGDHRLHRRPPRPGPGRPVGLKLLVEGFSQESNALLGTVVEAIGGAHGVGGEIGTQLLTNEVDEILEGGAKRGALAAGQRDGKGPIRLAEVVDVGSIGRGFAGGMDRLDELPHEGETAAPGESAHEDVLAGSRRLEAELEGLDGVVLAHDPGLRLDLGGGGEGEPAFRAGPSESFAGKSQVIARDGDLGNLGGHQPPRAVGTARPA